MNNNSQALITGLTNDKQLTVMVADTDYTVLYVDDEESNLRIFRSAFKWHYNVLIAPDAHTAFALLKENDVQVVLSDQRMPRTSGVEFLKVVAELYPNTIRMILTGYSDTESIATAVNHAGIFRYLTKPWDTGEMKLAIDRAIETYKLQADNRKLINDLRQMNENLEEMVKERTAQLTDANTILTEQKEELRANQEALATQNKKLMQLNIEKNDIIGIVAHDLRSPLTTISGLARLIDKQSDCLSDDLKKAVELIITTSVRLTDTVTRILDVNAIESKSLVPKLAPVNLNQLVVDLVGNFKTQVEEKNITLEVVPCSQNAPTAMADLHLLINVLENLISNAIKFTYPGKNILIGVVCLKDTTTIRITDQGPGIKPEDMAKLFGTYQKLSAKPTAGEASSGLGLSIVKRYTEAMNGRVWCESQVGHGATFILELPKYL